jgi:Flp pilus assembly protein TadG
MRWFYRRKAGTFSVAEDGVVAVEFVILFPLFMLIILGIVEFGYLFHVRHTLTNASREGARAAVVYTTNYGTFADRKSWAEDRATKAVANYFAVTKFVIIPSVTFPNTNGGATGDSFSVTVGTDNGLLLLDVLIPDIGLKTVSAETTMRME